VTSIAQVLVHWSGLAPENATWEDVNDLKRRFPHAPAWGQAGFQEGGNVSDLAPPASEPSNSTPAQDPVAPRRSIRQTRAPAWLAGVTPQPLDQGGTPVLSAIPWTSR
jgi:hypothetical protein